MQFSSFQTVGVHKTILVDSRTWVIDVGTGEKGFGDWGLGLPTVCAGDRSSLTALNGCSWIF